MSLMLVRRGEEGRWGTEAGVEVGLRHRSLKSSRQKTGIKRSTTILALYKKTSSKPRPWAV